MKEIELNDGTTIVDLGDEIVIFNTPIKDLRKEHHTYMANCSSFVTKKGRPAISITSGTEYEVTEHYGSGDRNWNNWHNRRSVNIFFSKAIATSNGGGCWYEIEIKKAFEVVNSMEQQEYEDEISNMEREVK